MHWEAICGSASLGMRMKAEYGDHVRVAVEGHVAVVTINRPPHNFVALNFMTDLADAFDAADADENIRVSVLQAAGKSFCAGADLATSDEKAAQATKDGIPGLYAQAVRLYSAKKPIIAAIQGAAVGAGLGLALVADFRIVTPDARFCANFVKLAFHPGFAISLRLPQLIGEQKASLMMLTGRRIKGEEALAWGLADEMVLPEDLRSVALRLAQEIAEGGPLAIVEIRGTSRDGLADAVRARTAYEFEKQNRLNKTQDFAEGVRSVAERRPGRFVGR
jgi:enoyl-CoA hydratase/carnithine racemase